MGKIQKGILGGFSGTVGPVVGANWRGVDIIRSRPKKTARIPTDAQSQQRARFALVAHFLRVIRPLLRIYFGQAAVEKSKSNLATAYHLTEAVAGTFPNFMIDFEKVIISKGELLGLQQTSVSPMTGEKLNMGWTDNSGQGEAAATDGVVIAVYNEMIGQWFYLLTAAVRSAETLVLQLPVTWAGNAVHCWVMVVAADDKKYSNSEYFGPITLV
jgi:hypothetical protein